jgi:hypothetical protein
MSDQIDAIHAVLTPPYAKYLIWLFTASNEHHGGNYDRVTMIFGHPHAVLDSPKWVTDRRGTLRTPHTESGLQRSDKLTKRYSLLSLAGRLNR